MAKPELELDDKVKGMRQQHKSRRRRVSRITADKIDYIDFKDVKLLQAFVAENGKIVPRRLTGVTAYQQRKLAEAIKRARSVALLPYTKY